MTFPDPRQQAGPAAPSALTMEQFLENTRQSTAALGTPPPQAAPALSMDAFLDSVKQSTSALGDPQQRIPQGQGKRPDATATDPLEAARNRPLFSGDSPAIDRLTSEQLLNLQEKDAEVFISQSVFGDVLVTEEGVIGEKPFARGIVDMLARGTGSAIKQVGQVGQMALRRQATKKAEVEAAGVWGKMLSAMPSVVDGGYIRDLAIGRFADEDTLAEAQTKNLEEVAQGRMFRMFDRLIEFGRERERDVLLQPSQSLREGSGFQPKNARFYSENLANMAPVLAGQLGMAYATRGRSAATQFAAFAGPAALSTAGEVYGNTFEELKKTGLEEAEAHIVAQGQALTTTAVNVALEKIPGSAILMKRVPLVGRKLQEKMAHSLTAHLAAGTLAEAGTEVVQEWNQAFWQQVYLDDPDAFNDFWSERAPAAALLGGAAGAGLTTGAVLSRAVRAASDPTTKAKIAAQRQAIARSLLKAATGLDRPQLEAIPAQRQLGLEDGDAAQVNPQLDPIDGTMLVDSDKDEADFRTETLSARQRADQKVVEELLKRQELAQLNAQLAAQEAEAGALDPLPGAIRQGVSTAFALGTKARNEAVLREYANNESLAPEQRNALANSIIASVRDEVASMEVQNEPEAIDATIALMKKGQLALLHDIDDPVMAQFQGTDYDLLGRQGYIRQALRALSDKANTRKKFARIGAPETGRALANQASLERVHLRDAEVSMRNTVIALQQGTGMREVLGPMERELVYVAEDGKRWAKLKQNNPIIAAQLEGAREQLRRYMDAAGALLKQAGAIQNEWKENVILGLEVRRDNAQTAQEIQAYNEAIAEVKELEFVSASFVPEVVLLLESELLNDPLRAADMVKKTHQLAFANPKDQRKSLRIKDLVDAGIIRAEDVKLEKIFAHYGMRVARDLSLARIKNAAQAEGLVWDRRGEKPPGKEQTLFVSPDRSLSFLRGETDNRGIPFVRLDADLNKYLTSLYTNFGSLQGFARGVSIAKGFAFSNPLILPLFDMVQRLFVGRSPIPLTLGGWVELGQSLQHAFKGDDVWREAALNGSFSMTGNTTLTSFDQQMQVARAVAGSRIEGLVGTTLASALHSATRGILPRSEKFTGRRAMTHGLTGAAIGAITGGPVGAVIGGVVGQTVTLNDVYAASQSLAWTMDQGVRLSTYSWAKQELGLTPREAGALTSLIHGDYANVDPALRRKLNLLFFTPTFKIAMGRAHAQMLSSVVDFASRGNWSLFDKEVDDVAKVQGARTRLAIGAASVLAFNLAWDQMMVNVMGFEREEWGRKYYKRFNSSEEERELVYSFATPANMGPKYFNRLARAGFLGDDQIKDLVREFQFEFHPILRSTYEAFVRGEELGIIDPLDAWEYKLLKRARHILGSTIALYRDVLPDQQDERTQEGVQRAVGKTINLFLSGAGGYNYTRTREEVRLKRERDEVLRDWQRINRDPKVNKDSREYRRQLEEVEARLGKIQDRVEGR